MTFQAWNDNSNTVNLRWLLTVCQAVQTLSSKSPTTPRGSPVSPLVSLGGGQWLWEALSTLNMIAKLSGIT